MKSHIINRSQTNRLTFAPIKESLLSNKLASNVAYTFIVQKQFAELLLLLSSPWLPLQA
jgi:hypothetical protein